jgi:hypothetical protein
MFNLCIDGLYIISRAKHSHENLLEFNTMLDIEIARLGGGAKTLASIATNWTQAFSLSSFFPPQYPKVSRMPTS